MERRSGAMLGAIVGGLPGALVGFLCLAQEAIVSRVVLVGVSVLAGGTWGAARGRRWAASKLRGALIGLLIGVVIAVLTAATILLDLPVL